MCAVADGLPGMLVDPASTVFGKDSFIAKANKTAVDPGGILMRGGSFVEDAGVPTKLRDPLNFGDQARETREKQTQLMRSMYAQQNSNSTQLG